MIPMAMPSSTFLFLIRDESLQLKSLCVVDVLRFRRRTYVSVHAMLAARLPRTILFGVVLFRRWVGGFGPCVNCVEVEEDVDDLLG